MTEKTWDFVHNLASDAKWTPGLREIFEYRDLGIKDGTHGDFVAHLIRHNGKKTKDEVQQWHVHDCTFQFVYVHERLGDLRVRGAGPAHHPQGRHHPADAGHQASRDRLLGGFRGAGDRLPGRFRDPRCRGPPAKAEAAE